MQRARRRSWHPLCSSFHVEGPPPIGHLRRLCLLVVLLWSVAPGTAAAAGADTNVTPLPDPTVQPFDPNTPPGDLKPGEKADAKTTVSLSGTFSAGFNNQTQKFFVEDVDKVEVSGQTVIRQPNNADDELKKHELGHHTLSKNEYEMRAAKKIADVLCGFKGMMFLGAGNTFQERAADAEKQRLRLSTTVGSIGRKGPSNPK